MIVGRMHTNLNRPPFALPQHKTQNGFHSASVPETGGYNELMFEDMAGGELIRMHGEKDMSVRINNDHSSSIGHDRSALVEQRRLRDGHERSTTHAVGGNVASQIAGQMTGSVGLDQLLSVGGSMLSMTGVDRVLQTVGNSVSSAATHAISSQTGTTISCGSSMIFIGPDSIVIQSPKVLLNPGADVAASVAMGGPVPSSGQ